MDSASRLPDGEKREVVVWLGTGLVGSDFGDVPLEQRSGVGGRHVEADQRACVSRAARSPLARASVVPMPQ